MAAIDKLIERFKEYPADSNRASWSGYSRISGMRKRKAKDRDASSLEKVFR